MQCKPTQISWEADKGEEFPQGLFNFIINTRGIGDHGVCELQNMEGQGLEVRGVRWKGDLGGGLRSRRLAGWDCLLKGTVA